MTEEQAKKLHARIWRLVRAEVASSWKGAAAPEDMPRIEANLKVARRTLNAYIRSITTKEGS